MTHRIRFALLGAVLAATLAAGAGAGGARAGLDRHVHAVRAATAAAREEARMARFARQLVGVPYAYGGTSPATGFDCSGFTRFVYAHFGIELPHYSGAQFALGRSVPRRALRAGDLVFFDGVGHVGIYLGQGLFIHAPHTGASVSIEPIDGWYGVRYDGARRIV